MSLLDRVRALLGDDAVDVAATPDGVPRVAPGSPDAVALLLGTAREERWRVRVEGAGTWLPVDAPADLALTTRRLDKVPAIEPQDLSATAEAGIGCDLLRQQLADRGTWLALDPPGLAGRTLGSVVATATAGPLRPGLGPVRDHRLGRPGVRRRSRATRRHRRTLHRVARGRGARLVDACRRELRHTARDVSRRRPPRLERRAHGPAAAPGRGRVGLRQPRHRRDPLGRRDQRGPPATAAPHAGRSRSAAHAGAGP